MGRMKDFYHDEIEKQMRDFDDSDFAYQEYMNAQPELSSCCGKPFIGETDFCSDCKEHAENEKVLICNNCKDIWIAPKDKCDCGCIVLTETHPSNKVFAKNKI